MTHNPKQWLRRGIFWGAAFLWMLLIFSFSNEPGQISNQRSQIILEKIQPAIEQVEIKLQRELAIINRLHFYIRKYAHVLAYFVLAILLQMALRASGLSGFRPYLYAWVLATGFAMLDEWHQTFIPGRNGAWIDVGIDNIGILLGLGFAYLLSRNNPLKYKRRKVQIE